MEMISAWKDHAVRLTQLQYVKLVASSGSIGESARISGVSQKTLSTAITELEEELRVKIFSHTPGRVELTPFGVSIIGIVESVFGRVEDIKREAAAIELSKQTPSN